MNKKQLITVLLIIFFFLSLPLDSAFSLSDSRKKAIDEIMDADGVVTNAYWVEEFDLDNDGQKEIIAKYIIGAHSSGVKVIKFQNDKPVILFDRGSGTPNTRFEIINNIPTLIFEESDYKPDYNTGKRYEEMYRWDGETFVGKGKNFDELLLHETSTSKPFLDYKYKNIKWIKHTPDETAESYKDEAGSGGQIDIGSVDIDADNKNVLLKATWGPGVSDHSLGIELYKENNKFGSFNAPGIQPNFKLEDIDGDKKLELVIWGAVFDPNMSQLLDDESKPFEGHSSQHLFKVRIYKMGRGKYKLSKEYVSKKKYEPFCEEQPGE